VFAELPPHVSSLFVTIPNSSLVVDFFEVRNIPITVPVQGQLRTVLVYQRR
jgi:hypothetical protein